MHPRNIKVLQLPARTDARQQQDLRRADGAGCEDHLAAAAHLCGAALATVGDARCAAAIEDHPLGVRVCDDVEVGAFAGRVQIADRGAAAPAVLRRKRSEEHTSELQSLMRISYAVFCLKKKKT